MLMTDVIVKKREGEKLSAEEIKFVVDGYTKGEIPDYQMSALLMAILLRGMDREETLELTMAMRDSGETLDLSAIKGVKADKHSTGGVGDKTTLIVAPITSKSGKKPSQPTHYYAERIHGLELPGMVLLEQIFTIDKERIQRLLGQTTPDEMYQINEALMNSLDLNGGR